MQVGGAGEIALRSRVKIPLRSKPPSIGELEQLEERLPVGLRSASVPIDLPRGERQAGISIGRLRSQLRGQDMGLNSQYTPPPS
ncbi:MAG: hypothetical protein SGPRY_007442, partial [Prymnesium sp.]